MLLFTLFAIREEVYPQAVFDRNSKHPVVLCVWSVKRYFNFIFFLLLGLLYMICRLISSPIRMPLGHTVPGYSNISRITSLRTYVLMSVSNHISRLGELLLNMLWLWIVLYFHETCF